MRQKREHKLEQRVCLYKCVCSEFRQNYNNGPIHFWHYSAWLLRCVIDLCLVIVFVWLCLHHSSHYLIDSYHIHPPLLSYIFFPLWKDEIVLGKLEFEYYATKIKIFFSFS
jgi:hypothetical protein